MTDSRLRTRLLALVASFLMVAQGAMVTPVLAAQPSPTPPPAPTVAPDAMPSAEAAAPAPTPAPTLAATPAPTPTASPDPTPEPSVDPADVPDTLPALPAGSTELVAERDATSRTYRTDRGKLVREIYAEPVFYETTPGAGFVPIEAGFAPVAGADKAVRSDKAPAKVSVLPADDARGFLALESGGFRVAYRPLVTMGKVNASARAAEAAIDGTRADLREVFPGVDARVFARAEGANTFLVLAAVPTRPSWTFAVDLPQGARLLANDAGGVDILDAAGAIRMQIAAPWAVDSTPDEYTGSGRTTTALHYTLGELDGTPTLTVNLDDPAWLASAVYPVYVDPSTTIYNEGTNSNGDTFANKGNKSMNYANYQRPDSPYYHEMWLGESPSDSSYYNEAYINWATGVLEDLGIDSATVKIRPYHQYYNAPTTTRTWLRQVTSDWAQNTLTWNERPNVDRTTYIDRSDCVEGSDCSFDVTALVRKWADDTAADYGIELDENDNGPTYWKRLIASEDGTNSKIPRLVVTYHTITTTATTPSLSPAITWTYADANSLAQTRYYVRIYSDAGMTQQVLSTGYVSSSATAYSQPPGLLSDLTTYYYEVRAGNDTGASPWATGSFTYDAHVGDEAYYTRVPYDLGGDWSLDVGVHNGELRLSRDLFSIPSYGPGQVLALSYSSVRATATGRFGVGWSSNLTQHLTFNTPSGSTMWHRADGGRVAFPSAGGAAAAGHYETLAIAGSEATVTTRDQTRYVFESSGAGRLKRVENRFGKALTLVWTTTSATATDASGRVTTLTINATDNRITGVTDSAGRSWAFGYTGSGVSSDLTCITDPASKVTRLAYSDHDLASITRGSAANCSSGGDNTWSVAYSSGGVSSITSPEVSHPDLFTYGTGSTTWRQVYDDASPPLYADTVYTLDTGRRGWVTSTEDAEEAVTARTFDANGNVLTETSPDDGLVVVTYDYDSYGNVTREERVLKRASETEAAVLAVTRYTYNATNDVLTRTDADNDAATRTVTRYTYESGHLTSENRNCTTSGTTIPGEGQGGTCTGDGTRDASTNVITSYAYTANDQLAAEQDPRGYVTKHVYDTYGNETAVIANCTSSGTTLPDDEWDECTTTGTADGGTHDAQTNVVTTTVYNQGTTAGKAGLPTSTTDALGRQTDYTYDVMGRPWTEALPGDTAIPALTRTTTYDLYGNVLTEVESWSAGGTPQTRTTTHTYDLEHRERTLIDPTGLARTTSTYG